MIGIIFIGDLKYCPYLNFYTSILRKQNKKYEVLYWSREKRNNKDESDNIMAFEYESDLKSNKIDKLKGLIKYRKWLLKRINRKKYNRIIVLSTLSGMIIADKLLRNYSGDYIFDIRDYSYEHIKLFKMLESKLINSSYATGISSRGFLNFLPKSDKYNIVHNFNEEKLQCYHNNKKNITPLNIVWLGAVRYFNHQKKIINHLSNDERFKLIYHGSGPDLEEFKNYVKKIKSKNILFTDEYDNSKKSILLKEADILNNSYYTSKEMETKFAISNKYYDGIFHGIPQLSEVGTYKADLIEENSLGFCIDVEDKDFASMLFNSYQLFSMEDFSESIKELQKIILKENLEYKKVVQNFVKRDEQ